jgi:hypothetical protein
MQKMYTKNEKKHKKSKKNAHQKSSVLNTQKMQKNAPKKYKKK